MSLWSLIFTNLRRHRVRSASGATGIAFGVATMLSVVGLLGGAVKMFERILRSDAEMVVFEKNVSDLFFSKVPVTLVDDLERQPFVKEAQPVLFAIVTAPDRPVVTCFGIRAEDGRLKKAEWLSGSAASFRDDGGDVVLGERAADFLEATAGDEVELGQGKHKDGFSSVVTVALADGHESSEAKAWIGTEHPKMTAPENEEFSRSCSQFKIIKTTAGRTIGSERERAFAMLLELVRAKGRTLVMATHDLELAMRCDRVIRMRDGRIVSDAT